MTYHRPSTSTAIYHSSFETFVPAPLSLRFCRSYPSSRCNHVAHPFGPPLSLRLPFLTPATYVPLVPPEVQHAKCLFLTKRDVNKCRTIARGANLETAGALDRVGPAVVLQLHVP